jgi:hypothetical protein
MAGGVLGSGVKKAPRLDTRGWGLQVEKLFNQG